jgi:hypothetical protein
MNEYKVLKKIVLSSRHKPTGNTKHYKTLEVDLDKSEISLQKTEIQPPHSLEIIQFKSDIDYYLIYKDEFDEELTDTYHETLESALKQAEWEFGIKLEDWNS